VAVDLVPDTWLGEDPEARREELKRFFNVRLAPTRPFHEEAEQCRVQAMGGP
jgi:hypothetical protein